MKSSMVSNLRSRKDQSQDISKISDKYSRPLTVFRSIGLFVTSMVSYAHTPANVEAVCRAFLEKRSERENNKMNYSKTTNTSTTANYHNTHHYIYIHRHHHPRHYFSINNTSHHPLGTSNLKEPTRFQTGS